MVVMAGSSSLAKTIGKVKAILGVLTLTMLFVAYAMK
jgi:hypothetical protein